MSIQPYLQQIKELLTQAVDFSSIPLSILLIALEAIIDQKFVCPCMFLINSFITAFIFIGPSLFTFALMCILLRPCRYGCCRIVAGPNEADDVQQNCPRAFASCLIPPAMWVFMLLLDGDYLACALSYWDGKYIWNKELNRTWCQPTVEDNIEWWRYEYKTYIFISQILGYALLSVISVLIIIFVCGYDCCISGKSSCCTGTESGSQDRVQVVELELVSRQPV